MALPQCQSSSSHLLPNPTQKTSFLSSLSEPNLSLWLCGAKHVVLIVCCVAATGAPGAGWCRCDFEKASLRDAVLSGANLNSANFQGQRWALLLASAS